jgi:hypothetical protein
MNKVIITILSAALLGDNRAGYHRKEPYLDSSSAVAAHSRGNGVPL